MNSLAQFQFESKSVRIVLIDNNPWFIGSDVCNVMEIANTGDAYQKNGFKTPSFRTAFLALC